MWLVPFCMAGGWWQLVLPLTFLLCLVDLCCMWVTMSPDPLFSGWPLVEISSVNETSHQGAR